MPSTSAACITDISMNTPPQMAKVVFMPSGRRGEFPLGTPVLSAARSLGVDIDSVCGGRAVCGRCQVCVSEGTFSKLDIESKPSHLSDTTQTEQRYRRIKGLDDQRRLSCQALLQGDVVIDVPPESQIHRQMVRKGADEIRDLTIDPVVRLYYLELSKPSMADQVCDLSRVTQSLERDWGLKRPARRDQFLNPSFRCCASWHHLCRRLEDHGGSASGYNAGCGVAWLQRRRLWYCCRCGYHHRCCSPL